MSDPFAGMNESIFACLGEDAFLRGEACKIELSHGVEVVIGGEYSNVVAHKSVANIEHGSLAKPKTGDEITIDTKTYTLDSLLKDDGYSSRWVVN